MKKTPKPKPGPAPTDLALFDRYPRLKETLPHVSLAELPTPVERIEALDLPQLYVKRDDLSGSVYGGNKLRKLEFLLGDALAQGAKEVLTFGCAGSNHATATALYAQKVGLRSINMLLPQPNAHSVRRNLLLSAAYGAELHFYPSSKVVPIGVYAQMLEHRRHQGARPVIIPAGGSSPLGTLGYVNAAFELARQVEAGDLPEPSRIYVAAGTLGTSAGLIVGLKAAGLQTVVHAVRVTDERFVNRDRLMNLCRETAEFLRTADAEFPQIEIRESDCLIRHECFGEHYALYTPQSVEAVHLFEDAAHIKLEGTYTGKAAAMLIADAHAGHIQHAPVLFWNTYNSRDVSPLIQDIDYHQLPHHFHRYFEEDVQPLDR